MIKTKLQLEKNKKMDNRQKITYTKNCLELLGYKCVTPDDKDFRIYKGENKSLPNMVDANFNDDFLNNWNWIMEIIEKILKDYRTDFYLDFDMPVSDTFTVSIGSDGNYNSNGKSIISSKEAVINAINQFLIWYKTNNNAK